jgi:hypothetical protein
MHHPIKSLHLGRTASVLALLVLFFVARNQRIIPGKESMQRMLSQATVDSPVDSSLKRVPVPVVDLNKHTMGDRIGTLTVTSIKPYQEGFTLAPSNATITFAGVLTLTGRYSYTFVENQAGDKSYTGAVCFDKLDEPSLMKLPWLQDGEANGRFCFQNVKFAQSLFQPSESEGTATVIIDNFTINSYANGVAVNTAELVDVI